MNVLVTSMPCVRDKEVTVGSFSVLPSESSPSSLTPCTVPEIPPGEVYEAVNVTELEIYKHAVKSVQTTIKSNAEQALKELDD